MLEKLFKGSARRSSFLTEVKNEDLTLLFFCLFRYIADSGSKIPGGNYEGLAAKWWLPSDSFL